MKVKTETLGELTINALTLGWFEDHKDVADVISEVIKGGISKAHPDITIEQIRSLTFSEGVALNMAIKKETGLDQGTEGNLSQTSSSAN